MPVSPQGTAPQLTAAHHARVTKSKIQIQNGTARLSYKNYDEVNNAQQKSQRVFNGAPHGMNNEMKPVSNRMFGVRRVPQLIVIRTLAQDERLQVSVRARAKLFGPLLRQLLR